MTAGPGLVGALLVGVLYGKTLAFSLDRPLLGVNHQEGNLFAPTLEDPELARAAEAQRRQRLVVSLGSRVLRGSADVLADDDDRQQDELEERLAQPGHGRKRVAALEGSE